jgi:hypothetical protein
MEHVTMSAQSSQKITDTNKTPKLRENPTWSDTIAWVHSFKDFTRSHKFDAAMYGKGTHGNQRDMFHCLSAAARQCKAAHTEIELALPINVLDDDTTSETFHGTLAWRNIISLIKLEENRAACLASTVLMSKQLPSQHIIEFVNTKDAAWRTLIRLSRGCIDQTFVDHHVIPHIDGAAYPNLRIFLKRHRRMNPDEPWASFREIILEDPAA